MRDPTTGHVLCGTWLCYAVYICCSCVELAYVLLARLPNSDVAPAYEHAQRRLCRKGICVHCFSSSCKLDPDPCPAADTLLLDRIGQRNVQALAQLYDRYSTLIYILALRLSGDSATAEEIVVDVFWELWQSADHFKGHSRLAAALLAATWRRAQQFVYQRL